MIDKKPTILSEGTSINPEFEYMLKSFLRKVQKEGVLDEVKHRRYYIKKSELKRLAEKERKRKK